MPVLSVIVPSYHASAYLSRCLDSIIGQTLKDLEIIVVSDGSAADLLFAAVMRKKMKG